MEFLASPTVGLTQIKHSFHVEITLYAWLGNISLVLPALTLIMNNCIIMNDIFSITSLTELPGEEPAYSIALADGGSVDLQQRQQAHRGR